MTCAGGGILQNDEAADFVAEIGRNCTAYSCINDRRGDLSMTVSSKFRGWSWIFAFAPASAWATDMPPVELLLIPPLLGMLVFTVLAWFATRLLANPTVRHFARLLVTVLLWTPVPVISLQGFGVGFLFSGLDLLSFFLGGSPVSQSPFVVAELGRAHLATAMAVSVAGVLGGILILARSWARLKQERP
jgi:hypothetical protein